MRRIESAPSLRFIFYTLTGDEERLVKDKTTRYATFNLETMEILKRLVAGEFKGDFNLYPTSGRFLTGLFIKTHTRLYDILKNDKVGRPDFLAFNKDKFLFIELKLGGDRLRTDQIKWAIAHPDVPIITCFIGIKRDRGQWGRKKAKKEKVE